MTAARLGLLALLTCAAGTAQALEDPQPGPKDPRVLSVLYDPMDVVRIVSCPTISTQIVFAPDEQVERVAIGDTASWIASPAGNLLFVKPSAVHPVTNMQVITVRPDKSHRDYVFELTAQEAMTGPAGAAGYYKVVFAYPDPPPHPAPAPRKPVKADAPVVPGDGAMLPDAPPATAMRSDRS